VALFLAQSIWHVASFVAASGVPKLPVSSFPVSVKTFLFVRFLQAVAESTSTAGRDETRQFRCVGVGGVN